MKDLHKIAGVLLVCLTVSCRKNQLDEVSREDHVVAASTRTTESDWTKAGNWNTAEQPTHSVFYTTIKADNVTTEDADEALVRVFTTDRSGNISSSRSLPFEETQGSEKAYWYYEVQDGNIMVSVDVYGSRTNPATNSLFKYAVLDNAAVQRIEKEGISRKQLMDMPYDRWSNMPK